MELTTGYQLWNCTQLIKTRSVNFLLVVHFVSRSSYVFFILFSNNCEAVRLMVVPSTVVTNVELISKASLLVILRKNFSFSLFFMSG